MKFIEINRGPVLTIMLVINFCIIMPGGSEVSHAQGLGHMGHMKIGLGSYRQDRTSPLESKA